MFEEVDKIQERLEEYGRVLNWVIGGSTIHGFKLKDASRLTWDYITINFNVNEFKCKHLKVSEMGMVVTADGNEYDGYCGACERQVYGTIYHDGQKERWK